jgi:replication-associated recombination protein RarA
MYLQAVPCLLYHKSCHGSLPAVRQVFGMLRLLGTSDYTGGDNMRLYEQFRPTKLSDVVGQPKAVAACQSLIVRKALGGQSVWISGPSGTGKTTIARILATEVGGTKLTTTEFDSADQVGQDDLDAITRELPYRSIYGARVWIVNEAHGLRKPVIRQLLGILERLPIDALFIFTTTMAGQTTMFEGQIDAGPLLSRCIKVELTDKGVTTAFAVRAREVAIAAGLDSRPLADYEALAKECKGNLREMLQEVESGRMVSAPESVIRDAALLSEIARLKEANAKLQSRKV